jgi:hypothetical protein
MARSARPDRVLVRFIPFLIAAFVAAATVSPAAAAAPSSRWRLVSVPHYGTFTGVSGLTSNDVWVVGYAYDQPSGRDLPITFHWDGTSLNTVGAPPASPGYNHLESVSMAGPNDVWAVGYHTPRYYTQFFSPLVEHWDGTAWRVVTIPYQGLGELTAVSVIAPNDVWAVGLRWTNPEGTLILHWDGTRWSTMSDGHASDNTILRGLATISPTNVLAGGSAVSGDGDRASFVERWNGTSWVAESTPSPDHYDEFNAMAADRSGAAWGVGWKSPDLGYFAFSERYDGSSWSVAATDFGTPNNNLYGVVMPSATQAWAVGYQSSHGVGPVIVRWDGARWNVDPNPARTCCTLYGIGQVGQTLWAVGDNLVMKRGL